MEQKRWLSFKRHVESYLRQIQRVTPHNAALVFRNYLLILLIVEGEEASVTGHKKQASDSDKGNESDDDKNGNNGATTEKKTGPNTSEGTARPPRKFGVSTNFFLHWLFTLGTAAGHEMFYIIVLPLIYWNANHIVSRRYLIRNPKHK